MKISVTEKAATQLLDSGVSGENFLRLGVQQGGCAELSYSAFIDDVLTEKHPGIQSAIENHQSAIHHRSHWGCPSMN